MKKEIPILFSTAMVQAIMQGKKTMTRRLVDMDDLKENPGRFRSASDSREWDVPRPAIKYDDRIWFAWELRNSNAKIWVERCRWKPKDILYVRETWRPIEQDFGVRYEYRATEKINTIDKWKPSLFMPKDAARIWLQVTDVRAERLKEISHDDAKAEGIEYRDVKGQGLGYKVYGVGKYQQQTASPIFSFSSLWESINGPGSWDANPWVWVIKFKVKNIIK